MIDVFFSETGMLFPFIRKGYVLSAYTEAKIRGFAGMRKSFLCLLNMIFAKSCLLYPSNIPLENGVAEAEDFFNRACKLFAGMDPRFHNIETGKSSYVPCICALS